MTLDHAARACRDTLCQPEVQSLFDSGQFVFWGADMSQPGGYDLGCRLVPASQPLHALDAG